MSTGVFGSVRPANINTSLDVDMYYYYRPSRGETDTDFKGYKKLNPSECIAPCVTDEDEEKIMTEKQKEIIKKADFIQED